MSDKGMPFSILPEESAKAYEAFRAYIEMDAGERSYQAVADQLGKNLSLIKGWGANYDWQERARAYDQYMNSATDDERRKALVLFQTQIIHDETEDYRKLRKLWSTALEVAQEQFEAGEIDVKTIVRLASSRDAIAKVGRRSAKLPTTYRAEDAKEEVSEDTYVLTLDGPKLLSRGGDE